VELIEHHCKDWQALKKKTAELITKSTELKVKLDVKTKGADEDKDLPADDKKKRMPPTPEDLANLASAQTHASASAEKLKADIAALMTEARSLKGNGAQSVEAMLVKPLQALMQSMTDLISARPLTGAFTAPSDGVVHLDAAIVTEMSLNVKDTEEAEAEAKVVKEAEADESKWVLVRGWAKELFKEDLTTMAIEEMQKGVKEENKPIYLALVGDVERAHAIENWNALNTTGKTLVEDAKVIAAAANQGIEIPEGESAIPAATPAAAPAPAPVLDNLEA